MSLSFAKLLRQKIFLERLLLQTDNQYSIYCRPKNTLFMITNFAISKPKLSKDEVKKGYRIVTLSSR